MNECLMTPQHKGKYSQQDVTQRLYITTGKLFSAVSAFIIQMCYLPISTVLLEMVHFLTDRATQIHKSGIIKM